MWTLFNASQIRPNGQTVFGVSPFVTRLMFFTAIFFFFFGWSSLDDDRPKSGVLTIVVVSVCAILGICAGLWWYSKCQIILAETELLVVTPFRRTAVQYKNIQDVRVSNNFVILDEGNIPRVIFSTVFQNLGQLLANIELRRALSHGWVAEGAGELDGKG